MAKISHIFARQILNSKGNPTVEAAVVLENGVTTISSCPTGTSVSNYEAKELRDGDQASYSGLGVLHAVNNVTAIIAPAIVGMDASNQTGIDKRMLELDGTQDKSKLGANAILPVSMASAKAGAISQNLPLFAYIKHYTSVKNSGFKIPTPAFNIINGGKHAGNNLDFQEFIVVPASSIAYKQSLNMVAIVYQSLKKTLKEKGATTLIGDEGGFGPSFATNRDALIMLTEAVGASGFRLNYDLFLGIDASANNFHSSGKYQVKDKGTNVSTMDLTTIYESLNDEFNLLYLEDPFYEDDWDGWASITNLTTKNTLVVGDDLTSTNPQRLEIAIAKQAINGVIIKPNQIGTILETIATTEMARAAGLKIIASHRSGDTNDDFIADFAVGIDADYVKFGAPARGERVAKYNRLSEIDNLIKSS